jgi:hypothetical protein
MNAGLSTRIAASIWWPFHASKPPKIKKPSLSRRLKQRPNPALKQRIAAVPPISQAVTLIADVTGPRIVSDGKVTIYEALLSP